MKLTALLPMKKNSERVPNKNMKLFAGYPLYHAIMKSLLKSRYIEEVIINTDSDDIAADASEHFKRVRIIRRPREIRGDNVSMNRIISHDLSRLAGEHFLQTHSTSPMVHVETIDKAIESYFSRLGRYDSLFSVTRWQTRLYWKDGKPVNHDPGTLLRTQDLPPLFEENSNFYIFSKTSFHNVGEKRIGLKPQMFEVDKFESVDIDDPQDFELAEILYEKRCRSI